MPHSRPWLLALAGLFALLLLALAGFVRPVRETVRAALVPVARFTSFLGAAAGKSLRFDLPAGRQAAEARAANERARELEARLRAISVDYVRLRALEEENRSLRAQVKFAADSGFQSLGARVISRALRHQTAAVTIDRGARDGIEVGQAVVTDEGLLVGKIAALGERTSVVMLVSDVQSRIAAAPAGSDRVAGVVEGAGDGVARFTLIPQAVELKRNAVIVTSGTEDKVPSNLAIGLVNDVQSQPTDPFKTASLEPLAPLDRLELVSVVIPTAKIR